MKKLSLFLIILSFSTGAYAQQVSDYRTAAEQGDTWAQRNLAACYYYGMGVAQDYSQAIQWYSRAAEQGDVMAQRNLGYCHLNGKGVPKDYSKAVYWFVNAAEQGDVLSQNVLGSCYFYGLGITQDYLQAVNWYYRAATQGYAWAQTNLATCYYDGLGVLKDNDNALYWYERALENEDESFAKPEIFNVKNRVSELKAVVNNTNLTFPVPVADQKIYDDIHDDPPPPDQANFTIPNISIAQGIDGYIVRVDGDIIYLRLNTPNIIVSDIVSVLSNNDVIIDPVTGQEIWLEQRIMGEIAITDVQSAYSIGKIYGNATIPFAEGMLVKKEDAKPILNHDIREVTVMVAPAEVNFPQGMNTMVGGYDAGYIGDYVTAALMEQLLKSNKIHVLDRSILQAQETEIELANSGKIDYNTMLLYGKNVGARYIIKVTMQKPDVVTAGGNIPIRAVLRTTQSIASSYNSGSRNSNNTYQPWQQAVPENVSTRRVKVSVNIMAQVVDLQTSRVLFLSKSTGKASGAPQLGFELAVGGNIGINQGADFFQTVTGKAVEDAFRKIGPEVNRYFDRLIK